MSAQQTLQFRTPGRGTWQGQYRDEPTNDLDIKLLKLLEAALQDCTEICSPREYSLGVSGAPLTQCSRKHGNTQVGEVIERGIVNVG